MPRRKTILSNREIYHIFNRGVEKRKIFQTERDYNRFLETIEHYQFINNKFSRTPQVKLKKESEIKLVEILGFCLMPNHFHLLLRQVEENGISIFMNRLSSSFTKYFNIKNQRIGPLFQGNFKAVLIESDEQLLHVSRYIHLNPIASRLIKNLNQYKWSSYSDYVGEEGRNFLSTADIIAHFVSKEAYRQFVLDQADYSVTLEKIKHQIFD